MIWTSTSSENNIFFCNLRNLCLIMTSYPVKNIQNIFLWISKNFTIEIRYAMPMFMKSEILSFQGHINAYDVISGPKWTGPDWSRAFLESICPMDLKSKVSAFSSKTQVNIDLDLYYLFFWSLDSRFQKSGFFTFFRQKLLFSVFRA